MQIPGKYADWQQEIRESPQINGESVKVCCLAALLLFIRRYPNKAKPLNNEFRGLKVRFEM